MTTKTDKTLKVLEIKPQKLCDIEKGRIETKLNAIFRLVTIISNPKKAFNYDSNLCFF